MQGRVIAAGIGERVVAARVGKYVIASTSGALLPGQAIATVGRHRERCRASRASTGALLPPISAGALLLSRVIAAVGISVAAIPFGRRCRITQHIPFAWRKRGTLLP